MNKPKFVTFAYKVATVALLSAALIETANELNRRRKEKVVQ